MSTSISKRTWMILFLLVVFAFVLRVSYLAPHLMSGDEGIGPDFMADSFPDEWSLDAFKSTDHRAAGNPIRIVAFHYGMLHPLQLWISAFCFSIFGLQITELAWHLPIILVGALSPLMAFILLNRLVNRQAAWFAALFLLSVPIHMLMSRDLTPGMVPGFFMQMVVIYFFYSYLEQKTRKSALLAGFTLAAYMNTHLQWPAMGLVLISMILVMDQESKSLQERVINVFKKMLRWDFSLFPILAVLLLVGILVGIGGPLLHMMHKGGGGVPGFYVPTWITQNMEANGYVLTIAIIVGFIAVLPLLFKRHPLSILFAWGTCYSLPYWFLISNKMSIPMTYYGHGVWAFTLLLAGMLGYWYSKGTANKLVIAIVAIIFSCNLYVGIAKTYQLDLPYSLYNVGWLRHANKADLGYKTAGYWARKHVKAEENIFSFAFGGGGFEGRIGAYYMDRLIYVKEDQNDPQVLRDYLATVVDKVDYVVIEDKGWAEWEKSPHAKAFSPHVLITSATGKVLIHILSKQKSDLPAVIFSVKDYNQKFDDEFANFKSLHGQNELEKRDGPLLEEAGY